ncbi:MAG: phosphoribosylformylglycinamidine synthase subunit PurL [Acidobacteria bacterium]|nr:phosphoribosylformylglycinamidine synthase subunit PurL [Acidobacteriota bacterium]MCB9398467.1 phosphoribosylformylglycinamidine synthase subunit PurL [Acidobacteriota bacterium]
MQEPVVDLALALDHGLTESEFETACSILGRTPSFTELGIFSAMWSEHCSYKSSKVHLRLFPTTGEQVLIGPGENAGAVDIGNNLAAIFKMESHNHPSFIEPYQGAATGVGGILRDVFTMGARPIANLDSLRFGTADTEHMKYLIRRVTRGIGDYGNCMGVPTVGGEVFFDSAYQGNILVNAMTVGLAPRDKIFLGEASGPGNAIMYVGSKTGRDGIHGATMASEEFSEESAEKRPTVQVGDPFTEKLLLEALMELFQGDAIIGIQDMGAAGLTSSSFEMAGRAGSGVDLDLSKVPMRETHMTAYEIMLSESQERMLLVCKPERVQEIADVFEKWDLSASVIGKVTETGRVRIWGPDGQLAADMPVDPLAAKAPVYDRPRAEPPYFKTLKAADLSAYSDLDAEGVGHAMHTLLAAPNIASKHWFYEQYDTTVQTNTLQGPGKAEAALVRIKGTNSAIAVTSDCNPRFVYLDPREGGKHTIAEAARNIACTGAKPLAITDCLNYGSPENPHVMWQFRESIEGMCEACTALNTPVVSGNVSFYNDTNGKPVFPTPSVGMVGLLADRTRYATNMFSEPGLAVYLVGVTREELGGSEYLSRLHGKTEGKIPTVSLEHERNLIEFLQKAISQGVVLHARDCSLGGLAIALAKSCFAEDPVGLTVDLNENVSIAAQLFAESAGRVVVALRKEDAAELTAHVQTFGLTAQAIGMTGGSNLTLKIKGQTLFDQPVAQLKTVWRDALAHLLELE